MQMHRRQGQVSGLHRLGLDPSSRVLVVGLGKTGLSVAKFLAGNEIELAVADTRENPPGLAELRELLPDVAVFLGPFDEVVFAAATHLIVSPGVGLDIPPILRAKQAGMPVLGDLELFACMAAAPVVAITGANGKSTVTTLVGLMAQEEGCKVAVGGNLGKPMLDLLDEAVDLYVLELSSFQLERSRLLRPMAATVLNISPDHLDRYPDIQSYADAKRRIFAGAKTWLLNADDPMVAAMAEPGRDCLWFSVKTGQAADYGIVEMAGAEWLAAKGDPVMPCAEVRIKGRHNLGNALAAMALAEAAGISREAIVAALREFSGLDHRMQFIAQKDGVTWINDSKATNVGACLAALEGVDSKVVLIAGGDGKGADFSVLLPIAQEKLRAAILMGRDAPALEKILAPVVTTVRVANMKQAVEAAHRLALPGDTVLLAPACASLDQYQDYQERGRVFAEAVRGKLA